MDEMEDIKSSKLQDRRTEIDETDKMQDARWKRADEMEQKDENVGVQMKTPRWKARASPQPP